jgi:hypothetical protein
MILISMICALQKIPLLAIVSILLKATKNSICNGLSTLNEFNKYQPYDSDPVVGVFEKPKRFDFQIIDYTYYKEQWVHVIAFKEKSKAQFYGELWINEKDNALIQFKFINTRPIKSIKLLGFEYSEPRVKVNFYIKNSMTEAIATTSADSNKTQKLMLIDRFHLLKKESFYWRTQSESR